MSQTTAELLKEENGGIVSLTLNRPQVLNSLTVGMMEGLLKELKAAEKNKDVRCVLIKAAGRAFCAGADLGELKKRQLKDGVSLGSELRDRFNPLALQIHRMEKPVLAAVNGIAAGAGASLALSCDIKICAEEAQFVNAFVRVGLVPDTGMTYDLPRFLGRSAALEHAWTAKPISARQALECGWVNRVVKPEELETEALKFCESLAQNPPLAIALTKRAINRSLENTFSGQMEYEAQLQEILGKTQDHVEGISAFLEKRKPHFEGK